MNKKLFTFLYFFTISSYAAERVLPVSIFSEANGKKQEDRAVVIPIGERLEKRLFLGVYDGHNGSKTAKLLKKDLHEQFFECLKIESSVKAAFESAIWHVDGIAQREYGDGSTAVVAYIEKNSLHVCLVGDSGLILESDNSVCYATQSHTIDREDERKRVLAAKAIIFRQVIVNEDNKIQECGPWRVNGLTPTRSIGDRRSKNPTYGNLNFEAITKKYNRTLKYQLLEDYKEPNGIIIDGMKVIPQEDHIIADPEYIELPLTEKNHWLALATDGFTDFVSKEEAVRLMVQYHQEGKSTHEIAKLLVEEAIKLGSKDNVTVVVCDLWELGLIHN